MYELIQAGENTFYVDCPSKMGIYRLDETNVCAIDTGNDADAGKKLLKHIDSNGWKLKMIINTHSHADHIGGNALLQKRTGCDSYCVGLENVFIENTFLEPSFIFGATPFSAIETKVYMARPAHSQELTADILPEGFEIERLDGHSFAQIGIKTPDDVWFIGDALVSEEVIDKYHLTFLEDVSKYLESIDKVMNLKGKLFIPSHAPAVEDVVPLAKRNRDKVHEIEELIYQLCIEAKTLGQLQKEIFDHYGRVITVPQYVLTGSIIKSYLSYLCKNGKMELVIEDNYVLWKSVG
jgi:glyoxylase-like metal-dependent hydrolase (beta-lactamase superfamily II)